MPFDFSDISSWTAERMRKPLPAEAPPRQKLRVYLSGPMSGIPKFNAPAFHAAAAKLRDEGCEVFNPAEKDIERCGADFFDRCPNGSKEEAAALGFNLRVALAEDLDWICRYADAIALLPGWQNSKGAYAEYITARALGLRAIELEEIK